MAPLNITFRLLKLIMREKTRMLTYQAGADVVSISSPEKLAVIKKVHQKTPSIKDIIKYYHRNVDIVLVEGYKSGDTLVLKFETNGRRRTQAINAQTPLKLPQQKMIAMRYARLAKTSYRML